MKKRLNVKLIKNYIKKNKLSQKEFCELCGISVGTLKRLIGGKSNMRLPSLLKVRRVLGVTLDSLLNL